jgi:uncharacterized protein (TIGR02646 family)
MEKINRLPITNYLLLKTLADNWQNWGKEYKENLDSKGKRGVGFSWRQGIYTALRHQLFLLTQGHCTFCDGYPIGETSKETIEHFYPKNDFPLQAYEWENLFYCCDKCQSEANKLAFIVTLKPDEATYTFDDYFYFDLESGELKVLENLEITNLPAFQNANIFLQRYGINNPIRNQSRINLFQDVKNHLQNVQNEDDKRTRDDFNYRYVYDFATSLLKN